jgi:hypothetical protein
MNSLIPLIAGLATILLLSPFGAAAASKPAQGPLRIHPENPRYFTDGTKRPDGTLNAVFLSGFQFWDVFDAAGNPSADGMEFEEFLRISEKYKVNFI